MRASDFRRVIGTWMTGGEPQGIGRQLCSRGWLQKGEATQTVSGLETRCGWRAGRDPTYNGSILLF